MFIKILCIWGILALLTGMVMHAVMYGIFVNAEQNGLDDLQEDDLQEIIKRFTDEELELFKLILQQPICIYIMCMLMWPFPWYKWGILNMCKMIMIIMKAILKRK